MTSSPSIFSSILNIPTSKTTNHDLGFPNINSSPIKKQSFTLFRPINPSPVLDYSPSPSGSCSSATIANSLTLDHGSASEEEVKQAESKIGSRVRVKVPLKVYHVPTSPEYELLGKVGVLKQYVGVYKGTKISANLPYKVEFLADEILGRDGKPTKFTAHLREDEFEVLDAFDSSG